MRSPDDACHITSTRASGSSTRTKSRTCSRCCRFSRGRNRSSALPRFCARGSCGSRTRRSSSWRRTSRRRSRATPHPRSRPLLHAEDQRRLELARADVPGWLALVDRMPPSELLDRVLAESAYAAEIGGSRLTGRRARTSRRSAASCGAFRTAATPRSGASSIIAPARGRRRRIQRDRRRHGRGQPDDHARGEGPRVSRRVPREPATRQRRLARSDPGLAGAVWARRGRRRRFQSALIRARTIATSTRAKPKRANDCSMWR